MYLYIVLCFVLSFKPVILFSWSSVVEVNSQPYIRKIANRILSGSVYYVLVYREWDDYQSKGPVVYCIHCLWLMVLFLTNKYIMYVPFVTNYDQAAPLFIYLYSGPPVPSSFVSICCSTMCLSIDSQLLLLYLMERSRPILRANSGQ